MKQRLIETYLKVAEEFSNLSYAERLKVGAIIVKDNRIISIGYNGTPAGWDNTCEFREYGEDPDEFPYQEVMPQKQISFNTYDLVHRTRNFRLKTKPEVLHAEENAIIKLARSHESGEGASLFLTHAPCIQCAKLIYGSGIKEVYYKNIYRSSDGVNFLLKCNVKIQQVG